MTEGGEPFNMSITISVDKFSRIPIYEQIVNNIEQNILNGLLPPGAQISSIRELSLQLGINPNTIQKSYLELARRGVLQSAQGSGYYVSEDALENLREARSKRLADIAKLTQELASAGISLEMILKTVKEAFADHDIRGN